METAGWPIAAALRSQILLLGQLRSRFISSLAARAANRLVWLSALRQYDVVERKGAWPASPTNAPASYVSREADQLGITGTAGITSCRS